jgi:phosphoribosylaminoimidazolecarboxamide formyltransferase/IMP cyclohydrolase
VRLLTVPLGDGANDFDMKRVGGGLLVQSPDARNVRRPNSASSPSEAPTAAADSNDLIFAWRVAKFVKSNAIVFCGGGMHDRRRRGPDEPRGLRPHRRHQGAERGAVDGRIGRGLRRVLPVPRRPRRDREGGARRAVIQPGGSMRDDEVIAAADEHGIAMVLTGMRHFRH